MESVDPHSMSDSNAATLSRDEAQQTATPARRRKPRPSRGRGLRVTTGCIICRARHMKCDEARPICGACAKSKRECAYGPASSVPRKRKNDDTPNTASPLNSPDPGQTTHNKDRQPVEPEPTRRQSETEPARQHGEKSAEAVEPAPDHRPSRTWSRQFDDVQMASPQSNWSGNTAYPPDIAPLRWFGLLAGDATNADWSFNPVSPSWLASQHATTAIPITSSPYGDAFSQRGSVSGQAPYSVLPSETVTLSESEICLFTHFVKNLSNWIDLTDPHRHFSVMVPHLALRNQGLMKAILALCARHLSIKPSDPDFAPDRTLAVQYYYETLQYLQQAMKNEIYLRSEELLATVLIISTYEMIDGEGKGWERHLKGVFWIQRSQEINGESGGLKQAIWWAWLRQDVWVAFREGRKVLSFFKPTKPYFAMDHWDIAARCVYLLAQCVNYSSEKEIQAGKTDLIMRVAKADELSTRLDDWYQHLTSHFNPLPCLQGSNGPFKPIWIHPPVFGVALQMYHFAMILLSICTPAAGGLKEYIARERALNDSIDVICGIALATTDDAASIISTQCIFAAGLHTQDSSKRAAILDMIEVHQARTGWPVHDLRIDLKAEWNKAEHPT